MGANVELFDEVGVQASAATRGEVEEGAFSAAGREGEFQLLAEGIPVALFWLFPTTKPFEAVGDVGDFVLMNAVEELGCFSIAGCLEAASEVARMVEVGLFESEAKACDEVHRTIHRGKGAPEVAAKGQFTEVDAALFHALEIQLGMFLFLFERLHHTAPEGGWSVGEFQEHERHELGREEFVIGKVMQELSPDLVAGEVARVGEFGFGGAE